MQKEEIVGINFTRSFLLRNFLVEFIASFQERSMKGKAHVQGNHLPDQGAIEKHLVNSKDPQKTPIVTQSDLDDRIMVITFYQLAAPSCKINKFFL